MTRNRTIGLIVAALLAACLVAVYSTREAGNAPVPVNKTAVSAVAVDSRLLAAANRLATLAETPEEQSRAREAQHLADHELDQAFETAMRTAEAYRPPAKGPLRELVNSVNELKGEIAEDQDKIAALTKKGDADALELAKAELALDQDELQDAQQDLARQGGDPHADLVRALQDHEAAQKQVGQGFKSPNPTSNVVQQANAWFALGDLSGQLQAARDQVGKQVQSLNEKHADLEQQLAPRKRGDAEANSLENIHLRSDQRKTLAEYDQRMGDCKQLTGVYQQWDTLVEARRRAVVHLLLISLAEILAIVLIAMLAHRALRGAFVDSPGLLGKETGGQTTTERLRQGRLIAGAVVQAAAVAGILLLIFGVPNQISTIIGLATAGITVVMKDFIVAFFGWFTLMGKNGIRVGDWVEINGVSGEVIEIGLLKTVLLEVGNWTETGHPTGRKVAFPNSFAMEGHYFNFSTTGQWLWDELAVTVPAAGDPYQMAEDVRTLVQKETEADSAQAATDWDRVTSKYGAHGFSATPAVNLRPSGSGVEIAVRYITHASDRYAMKSKLFGMIVDLLHKGAGK